LGHRINKNDRPWENKSNITLPSTTKQ
jgi:hypothetical protein